MHSLMHTKYSLLCESAGMKRSKWKDTKCARCARPLCSPFINRRHLSTLHRSPAEWETPGQHINVTLLQVHEYLFRLPTLSRIKNQLYIGSITGYLVCSTHIWDHLTRPFRLCSLRENKRTLLKNNSQKHCMPFSDLSCSCKI